MGSIEIATAAVVGALVFVALQEVLLRRATRRNDELYEAMIGVANGVYQVKIDSDGDVSIRKTKGGA